MQRHWNEARDGAAGIGGAGVGAGAGAETGAGEHFPLRPLPPRHPCGCDQCRCHHHCPPPSCLLESACYHPGLFHCHPQCLQSLQWCGRHSGLPCRGHPRQHPHNWRHCQHLHPLPKKTLQQHPARGIPRAHSTSTAEIRQPPPWACRNGAAQQEPGRSGSSGQRGGVESWWPAHAQCRRRQEQGMQAAWTCAKAC